MEQPRLHTPQLSSVRRPRLCTERARWSRKATCTSQRQADVLVSLAGPRPRSATRNCAAAACAVWRQRPGDTVLCTSGLPAHTAGGRETAVRHLWQTGQEERVVVVIATVAVVAYDRDVLMVMTTHMYYRMPWQRCNTRERRHRFHHKPS